MQGGIIDKEMPMPVSNVAVISPEDGKATRVGYRFDSDGTKVRVCRARELICHDYRNSSPRSRLSTTTRSAQRSRTAWARPTSWKCPASKRSS